MQSPEQRAPGKCSVPRPGSPVPRTPERREGLRTCYWEGPSELPERRTPLPRPRGWRGHLTMHLLLPLRSPVGFRGPDCTGAFGLQRRPRRGWGGEGRGWWPDGCGAEASHPSRLLTVEGQGEAASQLSLDWGPSSGKGLGLPDPIPTHCPFPLPGPQTPRSRSLLLPGRER